jgi:hypothetical protein
MIDTLYICVLGNMRPVVIQLVVALQPISCTLDHLASSVLDNNGRAGVSLRVSGVFCR